MKALVLVFLTVVFFQSCSVSDENVPVKPVEETMTQPPKDEPMDNLGESYEGNFISGAHRTTGIATINDKKTILTFTNFKTDNGPILEVYLATDTSATNYISLGVLKGIEGDFQYVLPQNIDYSVYNNVIIWCVDFKINFGNAILK